MNFSFSNLDLTNVTAAKGAGVLTTGRYVVRIREATIKNTKKEDGSKTLNVRFTCDEGVITDNINVYIKGSDEATRIGREQLKGMLECAGHPSPNNPGDVSSLVGLTVGIIVGEDGLHQGKMTYKVKAFMKPEDIGKGGSTAAMAAEPAPAIGPSKGGLPF